jgi:hypothetical protein
MEQFNAKREKFAQDFEKFLVKFDAWIASRKPNEIKLMALAIPALLLAIDYTYIVPETQKVSAKSHEAHKATMAQLKEYRDGGGREQVEQLRVAVEQLKLQIEQAKISEEYIRLRLTELKHLYFTTREWANHLSFITKSATDYLVVLRSQENAITDSDSGFAPKMTVTLVGDGSFNSVMQYLYMIEESDKIMPIEKLNLKIDAQQRMTFESTSAVWGIK